MTEASGAGAPPEPGAPERAVLLSEALPAALPQRPGARGFPGISIVPAVRLKAAWDHLPELVRWSLIGFAALAIGAIPLTFDNLYYRDLFTFIALYSMLGLGLNI